MTAALQLEHANYQAFGKAVAAIRRDAQARLGPADLTHLRRIERWGRAASLLGYALAPWSLNPLAAVLMSTGNVTRWLLMHHVSHRGYDRVPEVPARFTSRAFAHGWRRFIDWFDWILPEAWRYEHNVLHHGYTGEVDDPDLVEENVADSPLTLGPRPLRYALVFFFAVTWKLSYYAPNTFRVLENVGRKKRGEPPIEHSFSLFNPLWETGRRFWRRCVLPYGVARFIALPALFLPLGLRAAGWVLVNSLLAELLTNLHTFMVIAPNHAGDDLYRFDTADKDKTEYYARQVLGSVNFRCGGDVNDYAHMWLNYQIEHHVWPDLPMLQYQRLQPSLRTLCHEHGLPYVQQGVLARCKKLVDIMVGNTQMRRLRHVTGAARS